MNIVPVTLEGERVRLAPLAPDHVASLATVGLDEQLWRWTSVRLTTAADMRAYVDAALGEQRAGVALPFATVDRSTNRAIGSTRFGNIDRKNRRAEIGWTFVAPAWQRTAINTEAKYLMLRHAFENWGCVRVELKTDALNERSRQAILRLGAKEEGTLRSHMIVYGGRVRDSVYYSILDSEWPAVKTTLEAKLAPRRAP